MKPRWRQRGGVFAAECGGKVIVRRSRRKVALTVVGRAGQRVTVSLSDDAVDRIVTSLDAKRGGRLTLKRTQPRRPHGKVATP